MNLINKLAKRLADRRLARKQTSTLDGLLDQGNEELIRLGTAYGGWCVPLSSVVTGQSAVCVGAGEDISFDVELNKRGMTVFTIDPTPRAKDHIEGLLKQVSATGEPYSCKCSDVHYDLHGFDFANFRYLDLGLSDQDKVMRFWAPKDPTHVSHSIVNLQRTEHFFDAKCVRLETLCSSYGIEEIEILKLDIEGSEYAVLNDMILGPLRPHVVCAEFDEGINPLDEDYMARITDMIGKMKKAGYRLSKVDGWTVMFVFGESAARAA